MAKPSPQQVTQLLEAWSQRDEKALEQLIPAVYAELHRLAHRYMSQERSGRPLQTTALVNEAYLRLIHTRQIPGQNRIHFLAIAARLMRRVLVDYARTRWSFKGGGSVQHIPLDEKFELPDEKSADPALRGRQLYPVPREVDSPRRCAEVAGCAGVFSAHSSSDNFGAFAKGNR